MVRPIPRIIVKGDKSVKKKQPFHKEISAISLSALRTHFSEHVC
jgi:CII-binding regulator of phage lambda lysogenization HflD